MDDNAKTQTPLNYNDGYAAAAHRMVGCLVNQEGSLTREYLRGFLWELNQTTQRLQKELQTVEGRLVNRLENTALDIAQEEAPEFGFWETSAEEWPENLSWIITVGDKHDDEIEVEVKETDSDKVIREAVCKAIESRSAAAAEVSAEPQPNEGA